MIENHKTLSEKFLKKGFWLYLFSFIGAPIGYIIKIIISEELSVSDVGILYGIISLVTIISSYNDLGITESLKHFIPRFLEEKRNDKIKTSLFYALFMQLITSVFIVLIFYFGANFIAINYLDSKEAVNILKIFSIFFLGINIFQTLNNFFLSIQNTFFYRLTEFLRMFSILISVLFIYLFDYGSLENYSYSWLIGLYIGIIVCILIFYFKFYKKYFKDVKILFDKKLFKEIFNYAILSFLGIGASTILGQMDMQMIIYILGTKSAGFYTNYLSIVSIPFMIIGPIFSLLLPIISELHTKKDYKKIKLIKQIFTKTFLAIGLMFNIFFFVFSEKIAFILFGEKYLLSGNILKYSILFLVFNFLLQINFNIMAGIGRVKDRVKIIILALFFNFFTNLIFISYIGVSGGALATAFGWILIYFLSDKQLGEKFKINIDFKNLIKNIISLGILGFLFYHFGIGFFIGLTRIQSFLLILFLSIIWFLFFLGINYNMFKNFILEVKKLRGRK